MRPELVQAEALGHRERLLADPDCVLEVVRQHPVARDLAQDERLRRRVREVRDRRGRAVEVAVACLPITPVPADLREQGVDLGGLLLATGCEKSFPRVLE